jgi:hypothetical protein
MARRLRTPIWLLRSSGAPSGEITLSGGATDGADTGAGSIAVLAVLSGGATDAADAGAGNASVVVALSGGVADGADTGTGAIGVVVALSGGATDDADTGDGQISTGERELSGGPTDGADTANGSLVTRFSEAFPSGGFLPDDREDRDRRARAIRATLEGVARPKPKTVARVMREALAPAQEPPTATIRDAVSPATMDRLRAMAESAAARQAADDDDEDIMMLLGA